MSARRPAGPSNWAFVFLGADKVAADQDQEARRPAPLYQCEEGRAGPQGPRRGSPAAPAATPSSASPPRTPGPSPECCPTPTDLAQSGHQSGPSSGLGGSRDSTEWPQGTHYPCTDEETEALRGPQLAVGLGSAPGHPTPGRPRHHWDSRWGPTSPVLPCLWYPPAGPQGPQGSSQVHTCPPYPLEAPASPSPAAGDRRRACEERSSWPGSPQGEAWAVQPPLPVGSVHGPCPSNRSWERDLALLAHP